MAEKIDEEIKEFQRRVEEILRELTEDNGMEVYGNLKIKVANMDTLALLKEK